MPAFLALLLEAVNFMLNCYYLYSAWESEVRVVQMLQPHIARCVSAQQTRTFSDLFVSFPGLPA